MLEEMRREDAEDGFEKDVVAKIVLNGDCSRFVGYTFSDDKATEGDVNR